MAGSGRATLRNRKFLRKCAAPSLSALRGHLTDAPVHQPEETLLPDHVPMTTPFEINADTATQDTPPTDTSHITRQPLGTSPTPLTPRTPLRTPHRALETPSFSSDIQHYSSLPATPYSELTCLACTCALTSSSPFQATMCYTS